MKRVFVETVVFTKRWSELGLKDDDLKSLQNYIVINPYAGDIMKGTGGLIKLRWNFPNTGKSGGIRVLYVDFMRQEKIILINCYSKSERDNISDKEKALYKKLIDSIKEELQ
jgi:hypothetical protein